MSLDGWLTMGMDGRRIAVLVDEWFEDSELVVPMRVMKDSGARVVIVGDGSREIYHGKRGKAIVRAEMSADSSMLDHLDGIIIPGGDAPDRMRLHQPMIDLVKHVYDSGKMVAAIGRGPQLLISADIVRGRQVTSRPSITADLQNAGAQWVDLPLVQDGNLLTSRWPADIPSFNKAIMEVVMNQSGRLAA